uniref:PSP1 C-terminal domain-containing protein n=1 Tax=Neobodo designis TaxID=312471 RepID=A0A7S1LGE1_NEODS
MSSYEDSAAMGPPCVVQLAPRFTVTAHLTGTDMTVAEAAKIGLRVAVCYKKALAVGPVLAERVANNGSRTHQHFNAGPAQPADAQQLAADDEATEYSAHVASIDIITALSQRAGIEVVILGAKFTADRQVLLVSFAAKKTQRFQPLAVALHRHFHCRVELRQHVENTPATSMLGNGGGVRSQVIAQGLGGIIATFVCDMMVETGAPIVANFVIGDGMTVPVVLRALAMTAASENPEEDPRFDGLAPTQLSSAELFERLDAVQAAGRYACAAALHIAKLVEPQPKGLAAEFTFDGKMILMTHIARPWDSAHTRLVDALAQFPCPVGVVCIEAPPAPSVENTTASHPIPSEWGGAGETHEW